MTKRINIMSNWKEFNPLSNRSMKNDFCEFPSQYCKKISEYLNNGEVVLASPSCVVDIFTGEKIAATSYVLTDGTYSWTNSLGYYVEKYNLQIPKELKDKIINM